MSRSAVWQRCRCGRSEYRLRAPNITGAGDADLDAAARERPPAAGDIVRLVGVELGGAPAGPAARALDRRHRVDQLLEDGAVMPVRPRDEARERGAVAVRNNVALRAGSPLGTAAIRRIRAGGGAPFFAAAAALSTQARSQSIWSAWPRRSNRTRSSRSQTPSACQSRSRRQQVMPAPQPSSGGGCSRGGHPGGRR